MTIWNFPECGEPGYTSYQMTQLTRMEVRRWRQALKAECAGELTALELPRNAKDGPWRVL